MADSLFDDRYRYDYIYPRGRSGETLRAADTESDDRPVVIKRPAPNDAPPIRAGQEVSILNERKALMRLAGQPALTELLGEGQFFVGGLPHQYIVMERAEGEIVADKALELAQQGERLPELEMLVIIDSLLDLLSAAHAQDIIYNDVDAKHLFWDRNTYRLKIIDWGNAVFLEGDEATPQGVSRQSDVFQAGELIFFILSGGGRLDIPRNAGDDFRVDFGEDSDKVHTRLQSIVSRAAHPNPRLRYESIDELRGDLADYRAPLERERDAVLARVEERLKKNRSKDELHGLLRTIEPALAMDPGFPRSRDLQNELHNRLNDLEVEADVDAARIYLESGNWVRAASLLDELRSRARGDTENLVSLLLDWSRLLLEMDIHPTPPAVVQAITRVFAGDHADAAQLLLTQLPGDASRDEARQLQWLMAERVSARVPEVLLLRPNIYRLEAALAQLAGEGIPVNEPRALLNEIQSTLDKSPDSGGVSLYDLRDRYRVVVDGLTALGTLLDAVNNTHRLPNRKLPLSALTRALNAAMALADNMHVIGKQATASPRDAMSALDTSRAIDPATPLWDLVARLLNGLYELLEAYQEYVPAADGSDIAGWLQTAQHDLQPFDDRLFDEMLVSTLVGLDVAAQNWDGYARAVLMGNRDGALKALGEATDAVSGFSPKLSSWLGQLRDIITQATYIERHSLYGVMGRALADGWEAFDRGRLGDALQLGEQALNIARDDVERFPARRLRDLADTTRNWIERGGVNDAERTDDALTKIELLYTADENTTRNNFAEQMPTKETYLKAMGRALVEKYARSSTASVRLLFVNFILNGALDAHDGSLEDGEFWRDAAIRALGNELGGKHPATRALSEFIVKRHDLNAAAERLNEVNGKPMLASLGTVRKALEDNAEARVLDAGVHSLREVEAGVRDWSDGEFHAAGIKLENAIKSIDEVETQANITLTNYRAFVMELLEGARELHSNARQIQKFVDDKPDDPPEEMYVIHDQQVELTARLTGESYANTLAGWRDTYESFLVAYTDPHLRRSARLTKFNELFRMMFIDRHPAYHLYRHWYEVTENSPEFPAPPTDEPTPRLAEEAERAAVAAADEADEADEGQSRRGIPRLLVIGVAVIAVVVVIALIMSGNSQPQTEAVDELTSLPAPEESPQVVAMAADATDESDETAEIEPAIVDDPPETDAAGGEAAPFITPSIIPTSVPPPTEADSPTPLFENLPSPLPPDTPTSIVPVIEASDTPTVTLTATEEDTPTIAPSPRSTLPDGGLRGQQDLLAFISEMIGAPPWSEEEFSRQTENNTWRLGIGSDDFCGENDVIRIRLPEDLLESTYGNNAASRIRNIQAQLTVPTHVPELVDQRQVYFGVLVANAETVDNAVGLYVEMVQPGVFSLGQYQDGATQAVSQRSTAVLRVRLERDPATGSFTAFYENEQIGQPIPFVDAGSPVLPELYVRCGGVIVSVTEWTVTLGN
jgi:hypothetical protein